MKLHLTPLSARRRCRLRRRRVIQREPQHSLSGIVTAAVNGRCNREIVRTHYKTHRRWLRSQSAVLPHLAAHFALCGASMHNTPVVATREAGGGPGRWVSPPPQPGSYKLLHRLTRACEQGFGKKKEREIKKKAVARFHRDLMCVNAPDAARERGPRSVFLLLVCFALRETRGDERWQF